jgi:hypothetical protein
MEWQAGSSANMLKPPSDTAAGTEITYWNVSPEISQQGCNDTG